MDCYRGVEYKYAVTLTTKHKAVFKDIEIAWINAKEFMGKHYGEMYWGWVLTIEKHPSKDWYHFHGKTTRWAYPFRNKTNLINVFIKKIDNEQGWDAYTSKGDTDHFIEEVEEPELDFYIE